MKWPFSKKTDAAPAAPAHHRRREPSLVQRSYRAAYPDRLASGFGNVFSRSTRDETRHEIKGLIQHSRHAAHNFDFARAYEMLFRRHVIGPSGIRLKMNVRDPSGKPDLAANSELERAWAHWGKMGNTTICGRLSWHGVECVMATGLAREGGSFLRLHTGRKRGPYGFQVEPVPFDLLDIDLTMPLENGSYIESGMEFDQDGKTLAFHMWNVSGSDGHRPQSRRRLRIPASQMIYVLLPEEAAQILGVPRSATALRLMNMSETYQESAMAAANYGAAQMVFFKQSDTSGQLTGGDGKDATVPIDEMESGTMATLPPGMEPVFNSPHYPEAAIGPFMRHMGTSVAAGYGVAYETITGDMEKASFVTLKAGKDEERDEWRMVQRAIHEGLHDQVFKKFLEAALLSGRVRLPFSKIDKFEAATWRPRGWKSVNPKDDATANEKDLALGLKSRTEIAAERGRDFADICAEREAEEELMRLHKLPTLVPTPAPELVKKPEEVDSD